jgi:hypothetical protein
MVVIQLADELAGQLRESSERIAFLDPNGEVVGYFDSARLCELYAKALSRFDIEESRRRRASGEPTYTIEQIREHLALLDSESSGSR